MIYTSTILVEDEGKELFGLFKDYKDEADRSSIDIKKEKKGILITIKAKDSVALRASFNSISKLLTTYEKTSAVIQDGKRH